MRCRLLLLLLLNDALRNLIILFGYQHVTIVMIEFGATTSSNSSSRRSTTIKSIIDI